VTTVNSPECYNGSTYMEKPLIGFIGQGFVGKNLADNFADRGFEVVRYSLSLEHAANKEKIKDCDIVFIAVPTPTTPEGFDASILRKEISLVGEGKIVVIKSTILPGTSESIQEDYPNKFVFHSPEFLVAATARKDTDNPERNLVGMAKDTPEFRERGELILSVLPEAPYNKILLSKETELVKYIGNNFLYTKVVFMNMMYDLAQKVGADWSQVSEAVAEDPRIGKSHMQPVHTSERSSGRGAGGHCFPKDFEAIIFEYKKLLDDPKGVKALEAIRDKNNDLLINSGKDLDILENIYGDKIKQ
jgi:UDPglucose 6-dehydrogenase